MLLCAPRFGGIIMVTRVPLYGILFIFVWSLACKVHGVLELYWGQGGCGRQYWDKRRVTDGGGPLLFLCRLFVGEYFAVDFVEIWYVQ